MKFPTNETKIDVSQLTTFQRKLRSNIRAFLLVATRDELETELRISLDLRDVFRAACIRELLEEND